MTSTIQDRIEALRNEAAQAGDDAQVEICDRIIGKDIELLDSETNEPVELSDDDSIADYCDAIVNSLECQQAEGHVLYQGRTVYAL